MRTILTFLTAFLLAFTARSQTSIVVRTAATMHNPTNYTLVTPTSVQFFTSNGITSFSLTLTSNANATDWRADLGISDWVTNPAAPSYSLTDIGVTPFNTNLLLTLTDDGGWRTAIGVAEWTTNADSPLFNATAYSSNLTLLNDQAAWQAALGIGAASYELNDLTDVTIATPSSAQILGLNTDSIWMNTNAWDLLSVGAYNQTLLTTHTDAAGWQGALGIVPTASAVVDTVADLAATEAAAGKAVFVRGYSAAGDGGGGWFYASNTETNVDGVGLCFESATADWAWNRHYSGPANICWFGAIANDDIDDRVAISNALVLTTNIYIPPGVFNVNRPDGAAMHWTAFDFGSGTTVTGDGGNKSIIMMGNNVVWTSINWNLFRGDSGSGVISNCLFSDFGIYGTNVHYYSEVPDRYTCGILLWGAMRNVAIERLWFYRIIGEGIFSVSATPTNDVVKSLVTIRDCYGFGCNNSPINVGGSGYHIEGNLMYYNTEGYECSIGNSTFKNNRAYYNWAGGFAIGGYYGLPSNVNIDSFNTIEGNISQFNGTGIVLSENLSDSSFIGNNMSFNWGQGLNLFSSASSGRIERNVIADNIIVDNAGGGIYHYLGNNNIYRGNFIYSSATNRLAKMTSIFSFTNNPSPGDTMTFGGQTKTWVASITDAPNELLIGADMAESWRNMNVIAYIYPYTYQWGTHTYKSGTNNYVISSAPFRNEQLSISGSYGTVTNYVSDAGKQAFGVTIENGVNNYMIDNYVSGNTLGQYVIKPSQNYLFSNPLLHTGVTPVHATYKFHTNSYIVWLDTRTTNGINMRAISDPPNGGLTAPIGSLAVQDDGGTNSTLFVKQGGTGNTGWNAALTDAPRWIDSMVPAASMRLPSSGYPGLDVFTNGIECLKFDAASDESVHFALQLNHNAVKPTNTFKPHVHWTTSEAQSAATNSIVWGLEYTMANISSNFVGSTTIYCTNTPASQNDFTHTMTSFADITVTNLANSMIISCRLFRDADNDADSVSGDANLLGFDVHYMVDSLGSATP